MIFISVKSNYKFYCQKKDRTNLDYTKQEFKETQTFHVLYKDPKICELVREIENIHHIVDSTSIFDLILYSNKHRPCEFRPCN